VPEAVAGIVVFAHGSGSGRHSPRNRMVAASLHEHRLATLLLDLLTPEEEQVDMRTDHLRFDIALLADRLTSAVVWCAEQPTLTDLPVGYFGASTGGAAALVAAAGQPDHVRAIVCRGGRPDLAGPHLGRVRAPRLLLRRGGRRLARLLRREPVGEPSLCPPRSRCGFEHPVPPPARGELTELFPGRATVPDRVTLGPFTSRWIRDPGKLIG